MLRGQQFGIGLLGCRHGGAEIDLSDLRSDLLRHCLVLTFDEVDVPLMDMSERQLALVSSTVLQIEPALRS
ncbi:hypothetical protein MES4922_210146 [Mesorhizobium ventifaucium]|uniref:Carrier domain-containing protein n=2 Tax=Mesorhizobium ventifaucium TaxID=666020 RepID=A0ABN8JNW3_9HYPH|nr:hypothetical protein MES4922_210146 [Mesorhizobium ventifaucium]